MLALLLAVPLGIRVANALRGERPLPATYLPALEGPRERAPADQMRRRDLARWRPAYVVIGDSMAGTRLDEARLGELAGQTVMPLLQAGSGSAFWYLAFKNWVLASGSKPRAVLIFFRDTNLTDVMFRLDERYRWSIDMVAGEQEPELNAMIAARIGGPRVAVHQAAERLYHADRARRWLEPALIGWPADLLTPTERRRSVFVVQMNERLGLDHLRVMADADIQTADDPMADFDRYVERSVLPLMLRDAQQAGVTLCLVRVQRRPVDGRPPRQSAKLRRYIEQLRNYVEAHGAVWRDDTGDPELTLDMYESGDHIDRRARRRYTEILFDRLRSLFR